MVTSNSIIQIGKRKKNQKKSNENIQTKAIVFDMMGVIFTEGRFSRLIHELVPKSKLSTIRKRYNLFRVGEINDLQFWNGLVDDPINTEEQFLNKFKLDRHFFPLILKLHKKRKYKLVILSNIPRKWKNYLLKKFKFEKYFDELIFSCDIGVAKPDKNAYLATVKILNTDPNNILFIDDELSNLAAASKIGIKTAHIKRRAEKNSFTPNYEIKDLSKITEILGE